MSETIVGLLLSCFSLLLFLCALVQVEKTLKKQMQRSKVERRDQSIYSKDDGAFSLFHLWLWRIMAWTATMVLFYATIEFVLQLTKVTNIVTS